MGGSALFGEIKIEIIGIRVDEDHSISLYLTPSIPKSLALCFARNRPHDLTAPRSPIPIPVRGRLYTRWPVGQPLLPLFGVR